VAHRAIVGEREYKFRDLRKHFTRDLRKERNIVFLCFYLLFAHISHKNFAQMLVLKIKSLKKNDICQNFGKSCNLEMFGKYENTRE